MARDFIKIDRNNTNATHAQAILGYRNALRDAYERGKEVLAIMTRNHDGSVFSDLETLFGIPTGKGQEVFDLVNGSVGSIEGLFQTADGKDLTEQVG